jgi:hypothetical protein
VPLIIAATHSIALSSDILHVTYQEFQPSSSMRRITSPSTNMTIVSPAHSVPDTLAARTSLISHRPSHELETKVTRFPQGIGAKTRLFVIFSGDGYTSNNRTTNACVKPFNENRFLQTNVYQYIYTQPLTPS